MTVSGWLAVFYTLSIVFIEGKNQIMEELADYLSGEDVVLCRQVCWEHERVSSVSTESEISCASWISNVGTLYGSNNLGPDDPTHFTTNTGESIQHPQDLEVECGFIVIRKWSVEVEKLHTDDLGWMYGDSFSAPKWSCVCAGRDVRKRRWMQLSVDVSQEDRVTRLVKIFHNRFRSINPWFIERALCGYEFKIQAVLQNQRLISRVYNGYSLTTADPPEWAQSNTPGARCSEICLSRISGLEPIDRASFVIAEDWHALHDFMYTIYPAKDETGWQYATDFNSGDWTPYPTEMSCVRRRVWMRTLVDGKDLEACREAFYRYIDSHPRGVVLSLPLQRMSHYRKRWCDGQATLTDGRLDIHLEHNYQQNVSYSIKGCEVLPLHQGDSHVGRSADNKYFLFGLRRIGGAVILGKIENKADDGMVCVLNALSGEERDKWCDTIAHQLTLTNGHFFSHSDLSVTYGPPQLVDTPYFSGRLFKKGKVVWKARVFELRKSGVFAYYKRGTLIGEIDVAGCSVMIPRNVSFGYPFEVLNCEGEVCLLLAAPSPDIRDSWMRALRSHITATNEGGAAFWYSADMLRVHRDSSGDNPYNDEPNETTAALALSQYRLYLSKSHDRTGNNDQRGRLLLSTIDDDADDADDRSYMEGEGVILDIQDCNGYSDASSFMTLNSEDLEDMNLSLILPQSCDRK